MTSSRFCLDDELASIGRAIASIIAITAFSLPSGVLSGNPVEKKNLLDVPYVQNGNGSTYGKYKNPITGILFSDPGSFEEVAIAINTMTGNLESKIEELGTANKEIEFYFDVLSHDVGNMNQSILGFFDISKMPKDSISEYYNKFKLLQNNLLQIDGVEACHSSLGVVQAISVLNLHKFSEEAIFKRIIKGKAKSENKGMLNYFISPNKDRFRLIVKTKY